MYIRTYVCALLSLPLISRFLQPLSARLDEVLHISADKKLPPLAPLPPEMQPIPSKPLFFDLAKNYIELPNLEHRFKEDKSKEGGGISGFVRGWLWGGKK